MESPQETLPAWENSIKNKLSRKTPCSSSIQPIPSKANWFAEPILIFFSKVAYLFIE